MRSRWSVGDGDIALGYSNTSQLSSTFEGNGHTIANLWGRSLILENFGTISNLVLTGNLGFAHFKPRRRVNLQVGGTGQPGLSIYPVLRLGFVQSSGIG